MKYLLAFVLFSFSFCNVNAQVKDPVKWTYTATKKTGNVYDVVIKASLPKPWHIYSQNTGDGGPIPTTITFSKNPLVSLVGKIKEEGKLEKSYDENFKTYVLNYSNEVAFVQTIKLKVAAKTKLIAKVEYMVCNDEMCLPPTTKNFTININ